MNVETRIYLDKFQPREYQKPIIDALENKGYKKVIFIAPRRSGKDVLSTNIIVRAMLSRVGVYYYIFPTYSQGKKVIWDSITIAGNKFLDFFPPELVVSKNSQEMKITLVNNSICQIIGSDNIDSIVGSNPIGCVFSEYALQSPTAYKFLRPILAANDGWALFVSTPRGKNHLFEMWEIAQLLPDWFCYKLTLDDTNHIPLAEIEKDRREGLLSEDLIQQEYYCSFFAGIEGSYYSKYLDKLRLNNQIGDVPWEPSFKVHTAWDLGVRDNTSIIFFSVVGSSIRIIDSYENNKHGLEHYIKILEQKNYNYGVHIAPHDIAVKEWGTGMTRIEKAHQLGIKFTVAPNISIEDGIEAVRSSLPRMWIDERKCAPLIKALENYRQEYDEKKKVYKAQPLHNFASHFADAMRYLCLSLSKTQDSLSAKELDRMYTEAVYGNPTHNSPFEEPRW